MRCAIYFIPPAEDPLTQAAARWLRRDPYTGAGVTSEIEGLVDADHAFLTAAARRYGFHGTLKAPFQLATGRSIDEIAQGLDRFCARLTPLVIPRMDLALLGSFFALVPSARHPDVEALATHLMIEFDSFRAPLSEIELARRNPSQLSTQQFSNLLTWGHPNVLDQFRFHMTLTGPMDRLERDHVRLVLERHFGALANAPLEIGQVALFVEPEARAPFCINSIHHFARQTQRKTA